MIKPQEAGIGQDEAQTASRSSGLSDVDVTSEDQKCRGHVHLVSPGR